MESTLTPKSNYLLEAGIEILHEESIEWLNEITFWHEECTFLFTLFVKNIQKLNPAPVSSKEELLHIERELLQLQRSGGELDSLKHEVEQHERFLALLLENQLGSERNYRDEHKALAGNFMVFEKRFKDLKKDIFVFVKKLR
jgi:hypothetical protein